MTAICQTTINRLTRRVPDFPVPGVEFADLTPVFADPEGLRLVIEELAAGWDSPDLVAGIDARGFLLGSGVALTLGTGVLAVRKAGKLPPPVHAHEYQLEYGSATLEIPADSVNLVGKRVLIVDDVLATGGTVAATAHLLTEAGAVVCGVAVVLELVELGGRAAVGDVPVHALTSS